MLGKMNSVVAVVRCFNNRFIEKQVRNLLTIGVGKILVVVNSTPDRGSTRGYLGALLNDSRVEILDMFEGYTWSNALNRALSHVPAMNLRRRLNGDAEFRFVFNVSVEALFTKTHLEQMLDVITDDSRLAVVGTSFEGVRDGNKVQLGHEYNHPRNTGMLIRITAFREIFTGFDPRCDQIGSMEDFDFMLKLVAFTDMKITKLDMNVPLVVGANYNPGVKAEREQGAMKEIIRFWLDRTKNDDAVNAHLRKTVKEMGCEESLPAS